MICAIIGALCGAGVLCISLYLFSEREYTIVLLLTNGDRKTIPATRFSVPTTREISEAEKYTRTEQCPRGAVVYGWYRAKKEA